jgi:benzoyl-CoA reductase subunit B
MSAVQQEDIVGRARGDGQRIFGGWWEELTRAEAEGEPSAYVFVMGSAAEILESFGIHMVFPEITSLQAAIRKKSLPLITRAEDYGYSTDVCAYVKTDVGVQLQDRQHPSGRVPKPALVVATNLCNTYVKWGEIWERMYGCPAFVLDIPGMRRIGWDATDDPAQMAADVRYVRAQIDELIGLCERVTGKRFDMDRLVEILDHANHMGSDWHEVIELNKNVPAPFNAQGDGIDYMGVINIRRGTAEGRAFTARLLQETQEKVRRGFSTIPDERFRLLITGPACYPQFRRFLELFKEWGGVFVHSEYLTYASGGLDMGIQYDLSRPLDSLAEQWLLTGQRRMSHMFFSQDELAHTATGWRADGIVYHAVKSCRTTATSTADSREYVMRTYNIPCLNLESDLCDPRAWSEAQMKNRIDAYFEALAARKAAAAGV